MAKKTDNSTKETQTQKKSNSAQDFLAALIGGSDEEKKPKKRPYLHFTDTGLVIPFWAIVSVQKREELVQRSGHYVWMYELVINEGVESSPNMPFGEHTLAYETVELRDAKHDALIEAMKDHNYEFSEI